MEAGQDQSSSQVMRQPIVAQTMLAQELSEVDEVMSYQFESAHNQRFREDSASTLRTTALNQTRPQQQEQQLLDNYQKENSSWQSLPLDHADTTLGPAYYSQQQQQVQQQHTRQHPTVTAQVDSRNYALQPFDYAQTGASQSNHRIPLAKPQRRGKHSGQQNAYSAATLSPITHSASYSLPEAARPGAHSGALPGAHPDAHPGAHVHNLSSTVDHSHTPGLAQADSDLPSGSSVLQTIDLISKDESLRLTQTQMAEPNKFIEKLEKRVAVLEKIETNKKRHENSLKRQIAKQRELQLKVRKQNLVHQRQLSQMRSQQVEENRKKALALRAKEKEGLQQSRISHMVKQKQKVEKLNQAFFNPRPEYPASLPLDAPIIYPTDHYTMNQTFSSSSTGAISQRLSQAPVSKRHFLDTSVYSNLPSTSYQSGGRLSSRQKSQANTSRIPDQPNRTLHRPSKSQLPRATASRSLQIRKDRKALIRIQDTLRQVDQIQELKKIEARLLTKIYGEENADKHKYRSVIQQREGKSHTARVGVGEASPQRGRSSQNGLHQRRTAYQRVSPNTSHLLHQSSVSEESSTFQLSNIVVPSSFEGQVNPRQMQEARNSSVQITKQKAQKPSHGRQAQVVVDPYVNNTGLNCDQAPLGRPNLYPNQDESVRTQTIGSSEDNQSFFDQSIGYQSTRPMSRSDLLSQAAARHGHFTGGAGRRPQTQQINFAGVSQQSNMEPQVESARFSQQKRQGLPSDFMQSRVDSEASFNTVLGTINGHQSVGLNVRPRLPQALPPPQAQPAQSRGVAPLAPIVGHMMPSQSSSVVQQSMAQPLSKRQQQMIDAIMYGGEQGNNAFYQKIIMEELSLQSQQLQKEFENINKRKKLKKPDAANLVCSAESQDSGSLLPSKMTWAAVDESTASHKKVVGGVEATDLDGSGQKQGSQTRLKERDHLQGSRYADEKKSSSGVKVIAKKHHAHSEADTTQHVIKVYDRSNKHFFKQVFNNNSGGQTQAASQQQQDSGKNGAGGGSGLARSVTFDEDEDSGVQHIMHAVVDQEEEEEESYTSSQLEQLPWAKQRPIAGGSGPQSVVLNALKGHSKCKKGARKRVAKQKLVKPLPKMKIVVKSTKTISFDEAFDEDDSENEESDDQQEETVTTGGAPAGGTKTTNEGQAQSAVPNETVQLPVEVHIVTKTDQKSNVTGEEESKDKGTIADDKGEPTTIRKEQLKVERNLNVAREMQAADLASSSQSPSDADQIKPTHSEQQQISAQQTAQLPQVLQASTVTLVPNAPTGQSSTGQNDRAASLGQQFQPSRLSTKVVNQPTTLHRPQKRPKNRQRAGPGGLQYQGGPIPLYKHSPLQEAKSEDEDEDDLKEEQLCLRVPFNDTQAAVIPGSDQEALRPESEAVIEVVESVQQEVSAAPDIPTSSQPMPNNSWSPGGNDDLYPMVMMTGDNKALQVDDLTDQIDLDGLDLDQDGVFHYEQDHESLEEEVFELHTANKDQETQPVQEILFQEEAARQETANLTPTQKDLKPTSSQANLPTGGEPILVVKEDDGSQEKQIQTATKGKNVDISGLVTDCLDGVAAIEAKCYTSHQSSSDSRGNKDLLGMMNEELEHQTELLYEEE